jgi:arylsulfatase A-like enzyme
VEIEEIGGHGMDKIQYNKNPKSMSRRSFVYLTASGLAAALFIDCRGKSDARRKPNILFIAVDDLRPELGCYGNGFVISPHIDRLAQQGISFHNAYCQSAVCNPSRASLLTGLRPDSTKVWDLKGNFRDHVPQAVTIPQLFQQQGYYSAGIGKIFHNTIPDPQSWDEKKYLDGYPFDPDAVYLTEENRAIQEEKKLNIIKAGRQEHSIDRFGQWYLKANATEIADAPDNAYFDGAQTDWAVEKLGELKDRNLPFFLAVGYYRPHLPFNAPRKYWALYNRRAIPLAENDFLAADAPTMAINNLRELRGYTDFSHIGYPSETRLTEAEARLLKHGYLASVSYIDNQVGRLLDRLEELDLRKNTIVVLWGDHGWKLGEHNSWCKMTNYEIDTRVPLIISAPGCGKHGVSCRRLVEFVDIYPTLCELTGFPIPSGLEGISMVPLMKNPTRAWKSAVFTQFLREGIWVGPDGREYMGYAIRTARYRYVEWNDWVTGELAGVELYDLETDPGENSNIAKNPENFSLVQSLKKQLTAGWKAALPV